MSNLRKTSLFFCFFFLLFITTSSRVSAATQTVRLAGTDRYETSVKVSWDSFTQSDYVVLVSGENFPDGLSAAPLAKKYNAPILLTTGTALNSTTLNEIERLGARNVFIVGGPGVISQDIQNQLSSLNITCTRIYGQDRYETSIQVAKFIGSNNGAFICSGENFPDALSVSAIAGMKQMPILFTTTNGLPNTVKNYMNSNNIDKYYVVGGTGVISDNSLVGLTNVLRLSGSDRYETNLSVLNEFSNEFNFNNIYMASGENFPDALSASSAAAKSSAPLILTDGYSCTSKSIIKSKEGSISQIKLLGGTSIISDSLVSNIFNPKIVLGYSTYYSSSDVSSYNSMAIYSKLIDEIATDTYTTDSTGNITGIVPTDQLNYANANNINTLAMITNNFDSSIAKNLLESSSNRHTLIISISNALKTNNYKGVNIDIENIPASDRMYFTNFLSELYNNLHPQGYEITASIPAKTTDAQSNNWIGAYDYNQIASFTDKVMLMTYDEHWSGGSPGPIASINWVKNVINYAVTVIPKEKILLGIADYAYDWSSNGSKAISYGSKQAYDIAAKYKSVIKWDTTSECPYFNYIDSSGIYHTVWFENGDSIGYKLDLVNSYNLSGIAIWRLGLEDSNYWTTISDKLNK